MNATDMTFLQMIEANWLLVTAALLIALLLALWLFGRASRPKVRDRRPDVLDEGAAPAQRNQALIDTPPAASMVPPPIVPPAAAGTMAGLGEIVAHGARDEVKAAEEARAEEALAEEPAPAPAPVPNPVAPAPSVAPASAPISPAPVAGESDDLRKIKGVGPKLVTTLHALGITRYAQIAAWTEADLDALDAQLGAFAGRPRRDAWVEQARLLSSGDTTDYEAKFGKL
jgi:predicted flap endonuclease-1-like 5' DNA nuclease